MIHYVLDGKPVCGADLGSRAGWVSFEKILSGSAVTSSRDCPDCRSRVVMAVEKMASASSPEDYMRVRVNEVPADSDPACSVWEVVVEDERSTWREAYGTREQVRAFSRGVEAACSILGASSPEIETV